MIATQNELSTVLEEFPDAGREHLIPILQSVQTQFGYLSRESMIAVGQRLGLPISKVYGVATFYNQFRFQPLGKVHCQICRGTACHVKGSGKVLDTLRRTLQVEPGQTTRDGNYSYEVVACIGACGLAPVVTVNGDFHAEMSTDTIGKTLRKYLKTDTEQDGN